MPWFKSDSRMFNHPATGQAGNAAVGAWFRLGCWLANYPKQVDYIPAAVAKSFATPKQIRDLVRSGLLVPTGDGGWRFPDSLAMADSHTSSPAWEIDPGVASRRGIPAALRAQVYDRDSRACVRCGATSDLTLDHIYPWSLGGEDTLDNFQTLCRRCNSSKGARV